MKKGLNILLIPILALAFLAGILGADNIMGNENIVSASENTVGEIDRNISKDENINHYDIGTPDTWDNHTKGNTDISDDGEIRIVIKKSHQKLAIYRGIHEVKVYRAQFGEAGMGDKEIQGDKKTPEGTFYITEKSILTPADEYLGSRWMRLSYPNIEDGERGLKDGLIDRATYDSIVDAINKGQTPPQRTALGGGIGIHGGHVPKFGDNWTWGCVGLTNEDIEEIYDYISLGTPVIITK